LQALNSQGATIVVVTHDLDIASDMPREVHLNDGLIVSERTKAGVR
jgi:putative ABC transport system ATP-binding protein